MQHLLLSADPTHTKGELRGALLFAPSQHSVKVCVLCAFSYVLPKLSAKATVSCNYRGGPTQQDTKSLSLSGPGIGAAESSTESKSFSSVVPEHPGNSDCTAAAWEQRRVFKGEKLAQPGSVASATKLLSLRICLACCRGQSGVRTMRPTRRINERS